jgi:preprotein translocase subunit YajC
VAPVSASEPESPAAGGADAYEDAVQLSVMGFVWWLMQPAPSAPTGAAPTGAPGGGAADGFMTSQMLVLLVVFGIFYFLTLRPQQKRQKELDDMLKSLQKGDKVRMTSGIRGEVVELTDTEATLLIADKVKINVLRSSIGQKLPKAAAEVKGKD